jgi:uncharacterized damage-inducible protein DinB
MTTAQRLANHIQRTVTGPMWHGPALADVLAGVTAADAASHPVPGAHSIWELVLHVAGWADVARARLERPVPSEGVDDWPTVPTPSAEHWQDSVERLRTSYVQLAHTVEQMDDAALQAAVPGQEYSAEFMLHGVIEHGTYHGGQTALLRRALASSTATVS